MKIPVCSPSHLNARAAKRPAPGGESPARPPRTRWNPAIVAMLLAATIFASLSGAVARTWHILANGSGDAPTIQAAISKATVGDTILVGPGRFMEDITYLGKDLVVRSEFGPASTILDGSGQDSAVVTFDNWETNAAILEGFTITGGAGTPRQGGSRIGGGVFSEHASPTIINNVIFGNSSMWGGGIIVGRQNAVSEAGPMVSPIVRGNAIIENVATNGGGGLVVYDGTSLIEGNLFRANRTSQRGDGGGLKAMINKGSVSILSNEFIENEAYDKGGGIEVYGSHFFGAGPYVIEKNLFLRNIAYAGESGNRGTGGAMSLVEIQGRVRYNTIVDNRGLGPHACGGGGVTLLTTADDLEFSMNIVVSNDDCGVACWSRGTADFGPNLVWSNEISQIGFQCDASWVGIVTAADPFFCNPDAGDYHVASNSPAIVAGVAMGAHSGPGCGPMVAVQRTTWGQVKQLYRD